MRSDPVDKKRHSIWHELAFELDRRAKIYSLSGDLRYSTPSREGFITYPILLERRKKEARLSKWESIYEPLISELLKQEIALWVCIGHFTGHRDRPERCWLYYMSKELSTGSALARALRHLSFNAVQKEIVAKTLLLTSQLMELITPPMDMKSNAEFPYGAPLAISFQDDPFAECQQHPIANQMAFVCWNDLFEAAMASEPRFDILSRTCTYEQVSSHLQNHTEELQPIPFFLDDLNSCTSVHCSSSEYATSLHDLFPDDFDFLANPKHIKSVLGKYLRQFFTLVPDAQPKMARYVAWMQDVAQDSGAILTIPAWLPGEGAFGRSGALIICVRAGKQLTALDIAGIVTAFRLGCVNVAQESAFLNGSGNRSKSFSHEVQDLTNAVLGGALLKIRDLGLETVDGICSEWLVCIVPEFYDRLRWLLLLWIGKSLDLTKIGITAGQSAPYILDRIALESREIVGIREFLPRAGLPAKLNELQQYLQRYNCYRETYIPKYIIRADEGVSSLTWVPIDDSHAQKEYSIQQKSFIRLVVSAFTNTFWHALPQAAVKCNITQEGDLLTIVIRNESKGTSCEQKEFGTKQVLKHCLDELNGKLLEFPKVGAVGICTTAFELPINDIFLSQEDENQ